MKKTATIFSLAALLSCGGSKEPSTTGNQDAAADKAVEMTNGASAAAPVETVSDFKKYDIKSGIVTFETKMEMSGMVIKKKSILYFDDYGIKECEEQYDVDAATGKEVLTDRNFVKDGYHYICSVENKGGIKTKQNGYGVAALFNMSEAESMKENKFKKLPDETVCGKVCNAFSMETPSGKISMCGWNRIVLKTRVENESMKTETVAKTISENATIPGDKFEVPNGVKITEQ
ncbi:MAG: hypothetical protein PSX36_10705 [bacterium]|nr:hypothetical protein [bacterium]